MREINSIIKQIKNITIWKDKDRRAPHKPLLLLFMFSAIQKGEDRLISYSKIEEKLKELLKDFGPPTKTYRAYYPFWRLQNDGDFWEVIGKDELLKIYSKNDTNFDVSSKYLNSLKILALARCASIYVGIMVVAIV